MEDEKTGDLWETKDQRADTETTFFEHEISNLEVSEKRKDQLRRILKKNEGQNHGEAGTGKTTRKERNQQNRDEWERRVVETYASQLSLTSHQKRRTTHLVQDVMSVNSFGCYSVEQVILATINVVTREDGWHIEEDAQFRQYMVDVGLSSEVPSWVEGESERADIERLARLRSMVRERAGL